MEGEDKQDLERKDSKLKCLHCGTKAAERIVQSEGVNKDRKYYKCSNPAKPECAKFFKWAEQLQVSLTLFFKPQS